MSHFTLYAFNVGGSPVRGESVQGHVEVDYKSEVFFVNNLLIQTDGGSCECCQSATVVSGEDLLLAAVATQNNVLCQQIGQSVNGAR